MAGETTTIGKLIADARWNSVYRYKGKLYQLLSTDRHRQVRWSPMYGWVKDGDPELITDEALAARVTLA